MHNSDKFNILYVHNKSEISGGEQSLINLWENLDRNRFNLHLFLPKEGEFSSVARGLNVLMRFIEVPQLKVTNSFAIGKTINQFKKYIKENNIHLIHTYSPRNNIVSSLAGRKLKVPVIWHERNLIFGNEKDLTKQCLFLADSVICNSQAVADRFKSGNKIPDKIKVILNGVNINTFQPSKDIQQNKQGIGLAHKKIVGIISNLTKRKRVDYFLESAAYPHQDNSDVHFLIVGGEFSDEEKGRMEELKQKAKDLRIDQRVTFTGFTHDVQKYLNAFDVSVHVTEKEACSRGILESMACAKAVIAMNDGGNPELIENGVSGILVDTHNQQELVDTILDLLKHEDKRNVLGSRARKRVEDFFDVRRNALKTQNLYLELMNKDS